MYTLSSSVQLQVQVLNLLVQLIQLRVNYCLLDNDEVTTSAAISCHDVCCCCLIVHIFAV